MRGETKIDALEKREEGFEKRFAMQEEFRFRALARRNKAAVLWAASLLGLDGAAAEAYANALVAKQVDRTDDEALAKTLAAEFARAKVDMSDHRICRRMAEALARAEAEIGEARQPMRWRRSRIDQRVALSRQR